MGVWIVSHLEFQKGGIISEIRLWLWELLEGTCVLLGCQNYYITGLSHRGIYFPLRVMINAFLYKSDYTSDCLDFNQFVR